MGYYINLGPEVAEFDWRLDRVWDEYATFPPCQAIALRILREECHCVVYVREGVRVRHVRAAADGMVETVGEFIGCERGVRAVVTGWILEVWEGG